MRKKGIMIVCAVGLILLSAWIAWGNQALQLNTIRVSGDIPDAFDGFRIAQVSDLHNSEMGKENQKLLEMLKDAKPDMIAMTGDLIDSRRTDVDITLRFAAEAVKIAPCYYVPGNHESRIPEYEALKAGLSDLGVTVLEDAQIKLQKSGQSVTLIGVSDPAFRTGDDETVMRNALSGLADDGAYMILLSHRPELFDVYVENNIDLALCGHAHGGQVRIPFIGGVIAPGQGLFPKYDAGCYAENGTAMIVSRGIGNSLFPFRVNNRPEVVLVVLEKTAD